MLSVEKFSILDKFTNFIRINLLKVSLAIVIIKLVIHKD